MDSKDSPIVALEICPNYNQLEVSAAVERSLAALGGITRFVSPGQNVFVKVNLLTPRNIDDAVTTHPTVVRAIVEQVQSAGGIVTIGDSPGGPYSVRALKRSYRAAGLDEVAAETGAKLNFDLESIEVQNPGGKVLKSITIIKPLVEADVVIGVSKLKTHGLTVFTGAVKLMFGAVPGLLKAEYHLKMPDVKDFSDALLDIALCARPSLSVMDGVVGMEGDGPSGGDPRHVGVILAAEDPVACDIAAASIVGLPPDLVTTTAAAVRRGLTTGRLDDVRVAGAAVQDVTVTDFKGCSTAGGRLGRAIRPLYPFVQRFMIAKPVFGSAVCDGCGTCAEVCPPSAITMREKRPHPDYDKCIHCFCCQELCPRSAVAIKRPWLARRIFGSHNEQDRRNQCCPS